MFRYLSPKACVGLTLRASWLFIARHLPAGFLLMIGASQSAFAAAPTINYTLTPATLTVGQPYTIKWSTSGGAAYVSLSCTNGGIVEPELPITGQMGDNALASWVSSPPTCTISATNGSGQRSNKTFVMTTTPAPTQPTTTSLVASTVSPAGGAAVTLTATVAGNSPTGSIEFSEGLVTLATVPLSGGVANYVSPALSVGSHTITASYAGNAGNQASASAGLVVTWAKFSTATNLTASSTSPAFGAAVTFTATVSGNSPTGNIVFADGGNTLAIVPLSGGAASYASPALSVGSHTITASYAGNGNNAASASAGAVVTWAKQSTTTSLTSTSTAPPFGTAVTFTATVSGSNPTGNVVFADGGTTLATVPVSGGVASYASPGLSIGSHTITASYLGDGNNTASMSNGVGVSWMKLATTTNLSASSTLPQIGKPVTLTATVSGSGPTGNIVFKDGAAIVATVPLSGRVASYVSPALAPGPHSFTAAYEGNAIYVASVSSIVIVSWDSTTPASPATPLPVNIVPPDLNGENAGTLPGSLGVSDSGAATYGIPIVVPPGTAGMQPNLSLNYNSQAQNGILGLGWSLGGMSSIGRCGKTIAQDGVNERINFTTTDRLCLDGQRLVLVNATLSDANYWSATAEYRTEIESFSRIKTKFVTVNGMSVRSFEMWSKDGRISTYGSKADSYVKAIIVKPIASGVGTVDPVAKDGPQSWALDTIKDRSGNFIKVAYEQDATNGEHRPTFIRYGGSGLTSHAAVQFSYVTRPDAWKRYIDETRNDLRSRVDQIKTYVGTNLDGDVASSGKVVRAYGLQYEQSLTSGRSLLNAVQVSARNPNTDVMESLRPTRFDWGKPSKQAGFESKGFWTGAPVLTVNNYTSEFGGQAQNRTEYFAFNDFNADGLSDVLEKRVASEAYVNLGAEPSLVRQREASNSIAPGTRRTSYRYFHNTGNGFAQYTYSLSSNEAFVVLGVGDFDGNGKLDLFASTTGGTKICLSPLGSAGTLGAPGSNIVFSCQPRLAIDDWSNTAAGRAYVFDPVGDGRSAAYSTIRSNGSTGSPVATFCNLSGCKLDNDPPGTLALSRSTTIIQDWIDQMPELTYTTLDQSVDFAGVGKPYDVRFSEQKWVMRYADGIPFVPEEWTWVNSSPTITMSGLGGPDGRSKLGGFASFSYPSVAPVPSQSPGNQGTRGYVFDFAQDMPGLSADFNGSGYGSLAFGYLQQARNTDGSMYLTKAETTICLSTGRALDCGVRRKYSGDNYRQVYAVDDFVGDGLAAIMVRPMEAQPFPRRKQPGTAVEMCRVTGDDSTNGTGTNDSNINCTSWPGLTTPSVNSPDLPGDRMYAMDLLGNGRTQMVYYHSGRYVNGTWVPGTGWEVFAPIDVAVAGQALDRIYQVTNGLGASASVEYVDGLTSGIVRQTGNHPLTYPLRSARGAGKIVSKLKVGTGGGNVHTMSYVFEDPATDASGRGSPGFAVVQSTDEQSGIVTRTERRQDWPYLGMTKTSTVTDRHGVVLSSTVNAPGTESLIQANGSSTVCPVMRQSVTTRRDLSDPENANYAGYALATSTTVNSYTDGWCNINVQSTTTVGGNLTFNTTSTTDYLNDSVNWFFGLPKTTVVSRTDSSVTTASLPRTAKNEYDGLGMLKTQTVEPDDIQYKVVKSFDRTGNPFGLTNITTLAWFDPLTNSAMQRTEKVDYDANGRFPAKATNALGQSETYTYDAGRGVRTSLSGPNGLQTLWTTDGFGRVTVEKRADGNETRFYQKFCSTCPGGAVVATIVDNFNGADRTSVPSVSYSDNVGHVLRGMTWGFDGRVIVSDMRYDALGRLFETDHPRFESAPVVLNSRQRYDDLNRLKRVETFDTANKLLTTSTRYHGLLRTLTNAQGQERVETRDALGQVRSVLQKRKTDGPDVLTEFAYEVFGGLSQTTDPNKNIITIKYDKLGRKIRLQDPDLGVITYDVDPLGHVYRQISPKQKAASQSTTFRFDLLGRMTARYETDLESHWVFDQQPGGSCAVTHSCGQLVEAYTQTGSIKDYDRLHSYDALGRAQTVSQVIGDGTTNATFRETTAYDPWSRPMRQTYQRNADAAKVFDSRYSNTGYLARLERGALVLWQVTEQDAANRPIRIALGNGLNQNKNFNQYTDRLDGATLTAAVGPPLLAEGYDYNAIGNVSLRTQYWPAGGFTETFEYDDLNRLKVSAVGTQVQTFAYDDAGNIKKWTGGGQNGGTNYVYPAQGSATGRPHAVQQIDAGAVYQYDDNGNMAVAPGRTYTWSSFDMPVTMSKVAGSATITSAFVYGPEHQRTRQTRSDGSVEVYGGAQITERKGSVLTVKTYWPLGVGLEIDVTGAPTTLNWVHADRLGSPVGISDQSGALKEKLAYDAWGRRRSTDGTILTPDTLDGVIDNKGFTGHEMLEQLELVHMNGRVYDPSIGRFITADPLVSDPVNGQNYNRYSYVLNNPTNLTDPSGFAQATTADCKPTNTCPGDITPKCDKDCVRDANGKPVHHRENADGDWELDTGRVTSTTKSPSMQARADAKKTASPGGAAMFASDAAGNVMPSSGVPQAPKPDEPGIVERHVSENPCNYMRCNPWQQAQAAFTGVHTMVGEVWFKFTAAVGSLLPFGGGGPVVVRTNAEIGAALGWQKTANSAANLAKEVLAKESTNASQVAEMARNGFKKSQIEAVASKLREASKIEAKQVNVLLRNRLEHLEKVLELWPK